ncbi:MAG: 2,5-diamino-6-(ribosylamino)-4(3H)-pyrimidinone 5'-phosphate reductase [Candidatus Hodarchaeota archaeon]
MKRPYCILSSAISVDGKIATARTRDSTLSSLEDWKRVHRLRNSVDALMVGRGTIIADNPKLLVKQEHLPQDEESKHPIRIVTDSMAQTSPMAKVFTFAPDVPTIIAVSMKASQERIQALRDSGGEIIVCGTNRVDLEQLMEQLFKRGIRKLMLEGGGQLNWSMFSLGLVDELRLAIAPTIIGGSKAVSLFEGDGYNRTNEAPLLILQSKEMFEDCLVTIYLVKHNEHRQKIL